MTEFERFMLYVDTSGGPNACHPWTGSDDGQHGYGRFRIGGRTIGTARWLLGYLRGQPLNSDEEACHHCDNPPCCNPLHLYVGDHAQNIRDMWLRGRANFVPAKINSLKTSCPQGHPYDEVNTRIDRLGRRSCRACRRNGRGMGHNALKTHCPYGHPYDEANTRVYITSDGGLGRQCRACRREAARRDRAALTHGGDGHD